MGRWARTRRRVGIGSLRVRGECGFFRAEGGAKRHQHGREDRTTTGWGDATQRLIRVGHRLDDILNYTLPQIMAFLDAESRLERDRLATLLTISSVGAQGNKESIERLHRELLRED